MKFLDMLFPSNIKCIMCGREDNDYGICPECESQIPFITGKVCSKCGINISSGEVCIDCKGNDIKFERVFSIAEYKGRIRNAILKLKIQGYKDIANPLSKIIYDYFSKLDIPFDAIFPMPIHENRLKERGFNQCELMLKDIKENYGRVYADVLIRCKDTPHQTGLSRENRKVNLAGAFKVTNKSKVKGKTILIFDDIYTTGSSMNECAKVLMTAGAYKVYGLCLTRTPINLDKYLDSADYNNVDDNDYIDRIII